MRAQKWMAKIETYIGQLTTSNGPNFFANCLEPKAPLVYSKASGSHKPRLLSPSLKGERVPGSL